jgi:hypothetical protein
MPQCPLDDLPIGLTEAEKEDLEEMIVAFRRHNHTDQPEADGQPLQGQPDDYESKLADLTEMIVSIDRRLSSLVEVMRLSQEKSELLAQRLDAVIAALKKGHVL